MKWTYPVAVALGSMLWSEIIAAQAAEKTLVDSHDYIAVDESFTRCGDYFVVETKQFGDFEVRQVHVAFDIPTGVATAILYASNLAVVVDDSVATPVLLQQRLNPELEKDTIRLSQAAYDEGKECLPPPVGE